MVTNKKTAAYSGSRTGRRRITPLKKYLKKEANAIVNLQKPFRSRTTTGKRAYTSSKIATRTTPRVFSKAISKQIASFKIKRMAPSAVVNRPRKAFYPNK